MPRMPLHPASGSGFFDPRRSLCIRFARYGCTNRPFFHIVVMGKKLEHKKEPTEQLGTYDRSSNIHNEVLVSLNLERIVHWIGKGAFVTKPVSELLGLAGFFPIHPRTYMTAWRNRRKAAEKQRAEESRKLESTAAEAK